MQRNSYGIIDNSNASLSGWYALKTRPTKMSAETERRPVKKFQLETITTWFLNARPVFEATPVFKASLLFEERPACPVQYKCILWGESQSIYYQLLLW